MDRFGTAEDGRLFRTENGTPIQPSTYWQVWVKTRALALTPQQLATPLMRRPYDLRHSGVTWRLNSGVPATEVAAWAGHGVEVLMRVYARCVAGLEDVWIVRMDASLGRAPAEAPRQETPRQRYISEQADEKVTRATPPHGCAGSGAASGQDSGGRRRLVTESGGASATVGSVYRLIRVAFRWLPVGAPDRIRTCAHGSGGRSCSRLPPGKTRAGVPVGERMGGAQLAAGSGAEVPWCLRVTASMFRRSAAWREHSDGVSDEQRSDADRLAAAAEEVEAGRGPVAVARPGHQPVVLVSAEEWQRLQELESAESTAWWRRDAAERTASGEALPREWPVR
jgi:PHD/YefM family antitoxin component YafN of YafNO toxin-antitoxin module